MGCDIHLRVQRRDGPDWVDVPNSEAFGPDPSTVWLEAFDKELAAVGKKRNELSLDGSAQHKRCVVAGQAAQDAHEDGDPDQRCYLLFARLADVRNGFGFAGLESHSKVEPLFAHRGLPDDASDEGEGWLGDHSHTHASLSELLRTVAEDTPPSERLDVVVRRCGVVEEAAYRRWLETGEPPTEWSLDISGPGVVVYDHDKLAEHAPPGETALQLAARDVEEGRVTKPHFRMRWNDHALRDCGFARWLRGPRVRAVATTYGADDVRVLIGFDS